MKDDLQDLYSRIISCFHEAITILRPNTTIKIFGLPIMTVLDGRVSGRIYRIFFSAKEKFELRSIELAMAKVLINEEVEVFIESGEAKPGAERYIIVREERQDGIWFHRLLCSESVKLISAYYASLTAYGIEGSVHEHDGRLYYYRSRKDRRPLQSFCWSDFIPSLEQDGLKKARATKKSGARLTEGA